MRQTRSVDWSRSSGQSMRVGGCALVDRLLDDGVPNNRYAHRSVVDISNPIETQRALAAKSGFPTTEMETKFVVAKRSAISVHPMAKQIEIY